MRNAVGKINRSIDRVNDPTEIGILFAGDAFFTE